MTILDTSVVIDRVRMGEPIEESIVEVSVVEYPSILTNGRLNGKVLLVERRGWRLAIELQIKLQAAGKHKGLADPLIAAVAINRDEQLLTKDRDHLDLAEASELKVNLTIIEQPQADATLPV